MKIRSVYLQVLELYENLNTKIISSIYNKCVHAGDSRDTVLFLILSSPKQKKQ